jgi:type I restriction enzyme S subunit
MAGEWKEVPLGQLYDFRSGLSKPRSEFGSGHAFLSFKDVFYNIFVPNKLTELVNSTEQERELCSIERGDVFLTRTSETMEELGMSCVALRNYIAATFNGFTKRLRPKSGTNIVPEYAGYFFRSPKFRRVVTAMSSLSTRASLNNEMLSRFTITIPPIKEQAAIGYILKAFDDKIELNRRMNETLEAMASALFKSWFVDFDPVRAKAEGRDPGLPKPIADLFPDSFEDSELGEIPRGWRVGTLSDVATHPRRGIQPNGIAPSTPYIALEHMPKHCIALADWCAADGLESNKFEFKKGEILFGKLRPYFHKVGIAPLDGVCSTDIVVITPRTENWLGFVLGHTSSKAFVEYTDAGSTGTKMPRTSWGEMARYPIVIPCERVVGMFNKQVCSVIDRIIASIHESRNLAALRDTLLPKLMSGEVRVKDPKKFKESVA